ncbi:MAG TPA: hypothetical protein VI248_01000 [Kineosporiaceae bacterium]
MRYLPPRRSLRGVRPLRWVRGALPAPVSRAAPAAAVVAVPLTLAVVLRLRRLTVTSDSVAQQSVVVTWLRAGHRQTYLPPDTWLLKIPLYAAVEAIPLAPPLRLLVESVSLAVLAVALLAAGTHRLVSLALPAGAGRSWWDVALPLAWLGTVGGGLGQYLAVMPNSRNIELGAAVCLLAVLGGVVLAPTPRSGWRRLVRAAAAVAAVPALALLWVDDPYEAALVAGPLALACLAWLAVRPAGRAADGGAGRPGERRLLAAAAVLAGSLVAVSPLHRALAAAGVQVVPDATGVTLDPGQLAGHLRIIPAAMAAEVGLRDPVTAADLAARIGVVTVLVAAVPAATWVAVHGWRTRQLALAFLGAHCPLVVAGVVANRTVSDFHAGRYLVLAVVDLAVAAAVAAALLRSRRPRLAAGLAALLAAATLANLVAVVFDATPRPELAARQEQTLAVLERTGAAKGYSGFWAADLYTHQSGGRLMVSDVACSSGRLRPRHWLTDSARTGVPAARTFVLWDPSAPDQVGCSIADVEAQFGPPTQRISAPAGGVILLYDRDVTPLLATA